MFFLSRLMFEWEWCIVQLLYFTKISKFAFMTQVEFLRCHLQRSFPTTDDSLRGLYCILFSAELQYRTQLLRVCSY